jgi:tetratricopeptide (TPR) repeat protein
MTTAELNHYIAHPEQLNKSTLSDIQQLADMYPYCATFTILYAKNLWNVNDLRFKAFVQKAALSTYHRDVLQQLMAIPAVAVNDYSHSFISTSTVQRLNDSTIKRFNEEPTPYQLAELPKEEPSKPLKQQALIDKFIANNPKIQFSDKFEYEDPQPNLESEVSDSVFTESLAKIYIKQGQYQKALHIFEKLNLKYPEKNTYFADQIRFLTKIIQNS